MLSGLEHGAVLELEAKDGHMHLVGYTSWSFSKHEKNYGITDLKALGVVWAIQEYLLEHLCVVITDHTSCSKPAFHLTNLHGWC